MKLLWFGICMCGSVCVLSWVLLDMMLFRCRMYVVIV